MKKTLLAVLALSLLLVSCSGKWEKDMTNISQEAITQHQTLLEEHLAILKEDPENIESTFEVAYRYEHLGELKKAEKYYLKTIELDPNHVVAYNNLMNLYEEVGEYDKAGETGVKLLTLQPGSIETIQDVVRIFWEADKPDEALNLLEQFSVANKNDMTEDKTQVVSDLYEDITAYTNSHK